MPKGVALAKPAVTILRERRMVRHRILGAQPTEPAVGQIETSTTNLQSNPLPPQLNA
jgi:hypothetical protein